MALYTPFFERAAGTVGQAYGQKRTGELARNAYLGDQNAIGELAMINPELAGQIKQQKMQEEQVKLSQQAATQSAQVDAQERQRKWLAENQERVTETLGRAAQIPDYAQAQKFLASEVQRLGAGGVFNISQYTPETHAQVVQAYGPKAEPDFEVIAPTEAVQMGLPPDKQFQRNKQTNQISQIGGTGTTVNVGQATEGERTAGILANRLDFAQSQINDILAASPDAESPGVLPTIFSTAGLDYLARISNPAERQIIEAAQMDMLDAALTLGTGAAYTKEQLQGYRQSYFPQLGDDERTISAKATRLQNLISSAYDKAGRAAPDQRRSALTGAESNDAPAIGSVQNGYKFLGGNPGSPDSWEKQ
jgi:hypothetical protein